MAGPRGHAAPSLAPAARVTAVLASAEARFLQHNTCHTDERCHGEHYLEVVLNCTEAQVAADGGTRAAVLVRAAAACSLATRAQARARGAVLVSPLQQAFRWNWEM